MSDLCSGRCFEMSVGERASAQLELIFCSSEDERFPATNLTRAGGAPQYDDTPTQLAVWESESSASFRKSWCFESIEGCRHASSS